MGFGIDEHPVAVEDDGPAHHALAAAGGMVTLPLA